MNNRIIEFLEKPEEDWGGPTDFFYVSGEFGWCYVSSETARIVEAQLERWWQPRWIRFRDLFGSELRVRPGDITQVQECTAEQRKKYRAFERAREKEKKAERRWEDE